MSCFHLSGAALAFASQVFRSFI